MANFSEKNKLRKYLTYLLVFSALLFIYFFFLKPPEKQMEEELLLAPAVEQRFVPIEINWQVLDDPSFKALQPYLSVSLPEKLLEEPFGRDNPFLPLIERK